MKSVKVKLDKKLIRKVSADCSRKATWSACDHLAAISKQQVPLDTGALKDSCAVSVNADGTQAVVSYDTPYAVRQHEYTGYRHQRGRKAKYLEDPCNDTSVQNEMIEITKRIYKEGM